MTENIWIPSPKEPVQYRLVRNFPGWCVEAWVGNQCIMGHKYWLKSSARRHIAYVVKHEKEHERQRRLYERFKDEE